MRRRGPVIIIAIVVLLLAGALAFKRCRADTDDAAGGSGATAGAGGATGSGGRTGGGRSAMASASISGRVIRADTGAPIADANVSIAPAELMKMFVRGSAPTQIATTDATGTWKITGVRPGAYIVAATAIDYLPSGKTKVVIATDEQRTGVDIPLSPGGTLVHGTVTDVGGGPIPAARVTAHAGDPREMIGGMADFIAVTNAKGEYRITLPDGVLELEASHDDYTSKSERVELAGGKPATVDFTLIPGAVVRGQVIARDTGKPVTGAIVHAERAAGSRGGGGGGGNGQNTTTFSDDDGNFTLRSLPSGTLELKALGHGYASTDEGTSVPVGIGEQVDGVRVLVDRAYSISGHTKRRGASTDPVPGITLGAFAIVERTFGVALEPSAKDGAFEIVGLRAGSYTIFAVGEGSVPDIGTNVTVVDKDVTGVVVELDTGVTLSGRVEPPVAAAEIGIEMTESIGLSNMFDAAKTILVHGETTAEGSFVLKNVPAGSYKVVATAKDGAKGSLPVIVKDVDQLGLVVKLEPRASIAGRVADTSGAAAGDVSVTVKRLDGEPARDQQISFTGGGGNDATTSDDGTFKIVGLDAGKYRVRASLGGRFGRRRGSGTKVAGPDNKAETEITITAGEAKAGVALTVEARDGVITGVVMGTDGKAIGDAWVRARPTVEKDPKVTTFGEDFGGEPSAPVLTGGDGRFAIKKLVHGTYDLEVEGPRGTTHGEKPAVTTGDDVTIQLLSFGSLTGTVTLASAPVTKYTIDCDLDGPAGDSRDSGRLVEAKDGAYSLEHLQPGSYKCSVESDAGTGSGAIDIPAGPAKLDIALTKWASVSGTVVSVIDHAPIPNVHVFAGGENSARNMGAVLAGNAPTTDATGHFSLDHVAVGKGHVAVMPKRGFAPLGGADYTVAEGGHADVGAIAVAPPHDGPDGTYGMTTKIDGDKLLVDQVYPDGPAAAGGVQAGDQIASVDGVDVAKLTPVIAAFLLTSGNVGVGTPAILALTRAGSTTPVMVTITSAKW